MPSFARSHAKPVCSETFFFFFCRIAHIKFQFHFI